MWLDLPQKPEIPPRVRALSIIVGTLLFCLLGRLWYLQVALGQDLFLQSKNNTVRTDRQAPPRGLITDRVGRPIATVELQEVVFLSPFDAKSHPETVAQVAHILGQSPQDIQDVLNASQVGLYKPVPICVGLTRHQLTHLLENQNSLPGITISQQPIRKYIQGRLWAHLVGYVGPINQKELKDSVSHEYSPRDFVGKLGVEGAQEEYLRGEAGGERYEVDARGRRLRFLGPSDPVPGEQLILTADTNLQQAALKALAGRKGAVVAIVPHTGEVLTLVSSPSFDPNVFTRKLSSKTWGALNNNPELPLHNRAIATAFAPGSIFKMVTAAAGLKAGTLSLSTTAYCPGYIMLGRWRFRCHTTHGPIDFIGSISKSCDVFFYHAGLKMGPQILADTAREFGLGSQTGIDLWSALNGKVPNELRGNVPDPAWKELKMHDKWRGGDTVNMSIGQGFLTTTPIQMACVASMIANRGEIFKPQTVQRRKIGKNITYQFKPELKYQINLPPEYWSAIIQGMSDATTSGTAVSVAIPGVNIASKTGSAEEGRGRTHAWYVGFAPVENPQIALCVFVERGGHGGAEAAPVAKEVFKAFFHK